MTINVSNELFLYAALAYKSTVQLIIKIEYLLASRARLLLRCVVVTQFCKQILLHRFCTSALLLLRWSVRVCVNFCYYSIFQQSIFYMRMPHYLAVKCATNSITHMQICQRAHFILGINKMYKIQFYMQVRFDIVVNEGDVFRECFFMAKKYFTLILKIICI